MEEVPLCKGSVVNLYKEGKLLHEAVYIGSDKCLVDGVSKWIKIFKLKKAFKLSYLHCCKNNVCNIFCVY